jgi:hypothetical protein
VIQNFNIDNMCGKCNLLWGKQVYIAKTDEEYKYYFNNIDSKKVIIIDQRPNNIVNNNICTH